MVLASWSSLLKKREVLSDGEDGLLARYGKEQRLQIILWFTHRNNFYTLTKVGEINHCLMIELSFIYIPLLEVLRCLTSQTLPFY